MRTTGRARCRAERGCPSAARACCAPNESAMPNEGTMPKRSAGMQSAFAPHPPTQASTPHTPHGPASAGQPVHPTSVGCSRPTPTHLSRLQPGFSIDRAENSRHTERLPRGFRQTPTTAPSGRKLLGPPPTIPRNDASHAPPIFDNPARRHQSEPRPPGRGPSHLRSRLAGAPPFQGCGTDNPQHPRTTFSCACSVP